MNNSTIEEIVIRSLYVSMADYMKEESSVGYWYMYDHSLRMVGNLFKNHGIVFTVTHMNLIMCTEPSYTGRVSAIVDIATTLENLCPDRYAGKFKYT